MAEHQDPGVLRWYDSSRPMFIDLVGDYAGKELFLLEGDSLLRECFEDERIDFQCKFSTARFWVFSTLFRSHLLLRNVLIFLPWNRILP